MADEQQPPPEATPTADEASTPTDATPTEAAAAVEEAALDETPVEGGKPRSINVIMDVKLAVSAELGRTRMAIADLLRLAQGSIIELDKVAGEPLDFFINDKRVAKGEAVILNEKFGVRILEIMSAAELVRQFAPKDY